MPSHLGILKQKSLKILANTIHIKRTLPDKIVCSKKPECSILENFITISQIDRSKEKYHIIISTYAEQTS